MKTTDLRAGPAGAPLRHLLHFWLDVVFPPVCAHCRRVGEVLCPECAALLPRVPENICPSCGRFHQAHGTWEPGELCGSCRTNPLPLSAMRAPLRYEEPTSTLIHRFKYEGYFALGKPLAQFLIEGWPVWEHSPDLVLPVPLHPRRRRGRGFNQSELLAQPLGRYLDIPCEPSALRRDRHTKPQVGLGPDERHQNVRGAFSADETVVRGRHVLLVDDVLTTGATMTAAADSLLAGGAASVMAYCLARVN